MPINKSCENCIDVICPGYLRCCLLERQPTSELERKAHKAKRLKNKLWTREELDLARRLAKELFPILEFDD